MGSTNTGRFTDYSGTSKGKTKKGGSGGGGSSGEDLCDKAFTADLEEVERCEYFKNLSDLPSKGSHVLVRFNGRLEVTDNSGELIGYLPTKFNYLAACIQDGNEYSGNVLSTTRTPIIKIRVDIAPG